jgi:alcohol dehydrogenase class IV
MILNMPHGTACGATLPEALEFLAHAIPERIAEVARLMGAEVPADADSDAIGKIAYNAARELYEVIKMPGLKRYVKTKEELLDAVPEIMKESPYFFSARPVTAEDLCAILGKAFDR